MSWKAGPQSTSSPSAVVEGTIRGDAGASFEQLYAYVTQGTTGADECTRLSTTRDLQFAGLKLKAGDYTLWMLPTDTAAWTLTFNSDAHAFHTGRNSRLDVGKIALQKQTLPMPIQQLTFTIGPNPSGPGGILAMSWETTRVFAPFTVVK